MAPVPREGAGATAMYLRVSCLRVSRVLSSGGSPPHGTARPIGPARTSPNYVVDVLRQGEKTSQPIILIRTANFAPAEDLTVAFRASTSSGAPNSAPSTREPDSGP